MANKEDNNGSIRDAMLKRLRGLKAVLSPHKNKDQKPQEITAIKAVDDPNDFSNYVDVNINDLYAEEHSSPAPLRRKSFKKKHMGGNYDNFIIADQSTPSLSSILANKSIPESVVLRGEAATSQVGMPNIIAENIATACAEYGVAITVRSVLANAKSMARYFEGAFTGKSTNIHTKSTKAPCPASGHIAKAPEFFEPDKFKDLYDHQESSFPKEASDLTNDFMCKYVEKHADTKSIQTYLEQYGKNSIAELSYKQLEKIFLEQYSFDLGSKILDPKHNEKLIKVKMYKGKLCYQIERDSYRFAEDKEIKKYNLNKIFEHIDGPKKIGNKVFVKSGNKFYVKKYVKNKKTRAMQTIRQTDHYIQEAESIGTILDRIKDDTYKFVGFDPKTNTIKYATENPPVVYCMHLHELRSDPFWTQDEKPAKSQQMQFADLPKKLQNFIDGEVTLGNMAILKQIDQFYKSDYVAPVYALKGDTEQPILIVADPYPITNDFDLGNMALPKPPTLPLEAYTIHDLFSIKGRKNIRSAALKLLAEIAKDKDKASHGKKAKYPPETWKFCELTKVDPETGKSYLDLCFERGILNRMGAMSLGEFLVICALNRAIDPTGKLIMLPHGCESKNPSMGQLKPEPFGAMLHIYQDHKGHNQKMHTNDELSCLNFYLFNEEYMQNKYIEVHPYWIRERKDDPQLSNMWIDIIKYQALHGWSDVIKLSYKNMKFSYPAAYKQVMLVLAEVARIKDPASRAIEAQKIRDNYIKDFRGQTFEEFNSFNKMPSSPEPGLRKNGVKI